MRLTNKIMACLLAAGWLATSGNATVSAASFHEACSADIRHYCDTVTAGHGRIMACMYAHEDKVSEACDEATTDVGDILDTVFAKIKQVLSECRPDIEKHCGDVKFGDGAMLTCLNENSASLAEPCKAAVPEFVGDLAD
jgi:hypothetical protein